MTTNNNNNDIVVDKFLAVDSIAEINCATAFLSSRTKVEGAILGISKRVAAATGQSSSSSSSFSLVLTVVATLSPPSSSSSSNNSNSSGGSSNQVVACWQETFSKEQLEEQWNLKNNSNSSFSLNEREALQRMKAYLNIKCNDDNDDNNNKKKNNDEHQIITEWQLKQSSSSNSSSQPSSPSTSPSSILEIHVKQKNAKTKISQTLWKPVLSSSSSSATIAAATAPLCCFNLASHLLKTVQQERHETRQYQHKLQVMTTAQEARKESIKLLAKTNVWDLEKTKLLQNFIKLTKAKDECIQQLQAQIETLNGNVLHQQELVKLAKHQAAATAAAAATLATGGGNGNGSMKHNNKLDPCLEACPNDANELFDPEFIAQYAQGLPDRVVSKEKKEKNTSKKRAPTTAATVMPKKEVIPKKRQKKTTTTTTTTNNDNDDDDDTVEDDDNQEEKEAAALALLQRPRPQPQKRINAATGVIEYFGAEAAVKDLELEQEQKELEQNGGGGGKKKKNDSTEASSPPSMKDDDGDDDDDATDDDMEMESSSLLLEQKWPALSSSSLERDTI